MLELYYITRQKKYYILLRQSANDVDYKTKVYTTAERIFAEGFRPSAKAIRPSAKALPRAAFGKEPSGNFPSAKGSLPRAVCRVLGKDFAEG